MKSSHLVVSKVYSFFLSHKRKKQIEQLIFWVAIFAFIIHLSLILLASSGWFPNSIIGESFHLNPLRAIYTPFSVILLYEIYSLIYYLPKSIAIYLGKQYEIITLILIRKIFDNLARLAEDGVSIEFHEAKNLFFVFAFLLILLLLIFVFYKLSGSKDIRVDDTQCGSNKEHNFFYTKKVLAILLMGLFIFLFIKSLFELKNFSLNTDGLTYMLKTINNTFFRIFFSALILTEVLLLLFTFNLSDQFSKVIRNSGFIISTILLKLSFDAEGIASIGIILTAIIFGVAILAIYKLFRQKLPDH